MAQNPRIAGIILAAGKASRMGALKQLLPFGNTTLLGQVLINARQSALNPLILVLGFKADEILAQIEPASTLVVIADAYELGQSASLKAGLESVPPECDGALFLLGDQPLVSADIMNLIIGEYPKSEKEILIPTYRGKRGAPVLIGRPLFTALLTLTGDTGARVLFNDFSDQIREVPIEREEVGADVDTFEDYEKLRQIGVMND